MQKRKAVGGEYQSNLLPPAQRMKMQLTNLGVAQIQGSFMQGSIDSKQIMSDSANINLQTISTTRIYNLSTSDLQKASKFSICKPKYPKPHQSIDQPPEPIENQENLDPSLNESVIIKQIKSKRDEAEEIIQCFEKQLNRRCKKLAAYQEVQASHLSGVQRKKQGLKEAIEEGARELEVQRRRQEMEIESIEEVMRQEREADQNDKDVQMLLREIESLEKQRTEISLDSRLLSENVHKLCTENGQRKEEIEKLASQNEETSAICDKGQEVNNSLKQSLLTMRCREEQLLVLAELAEFQNHMISETPYTILAVHDQNQQGNLGLQMANGSFETVMFTSLSVTQSYNKVISKESPLVDWKDSLCLEKFIASCMTSTIRFISRGVDEQLSAFKNSLYRKATVITVNQDSSSFLALVNELFSHLELISGQQVIKFNIQNKKDSLQFDDIAPFKEYLHSYNTGLEQLKPRDYDCLLLTFNLYLTDADFIELSILHILTRDEQLFDFLNIKIQSEMQTYQALHAKKAKVTVPVNGSALAKKVISTPLGLSVQFQESKEI